MDMDGTNSWKSWDSLRLQKTEAASEPSGAQQNVATFLVGSCSPAAGAGDVPQKNFTMKWNTENAPSRTLASSGFDKSTLSAVTRAFERSALLYDGKKNNIFSILVQP
jgi:hypothetical protein